MVKEIIKKNCQKTMAPDVFKKYCHLMFVAANLQEDILQILKPELQHEYKLCASKAIKELRIFNRLAEKLFNETQIEWFDEDKETLKALIDMSILASTNNCNTEFLTHCLKYFKDEKIID